MCRYCSEDYKMHNYQGIALQPELQKKTERHIKEIIHLANNLNPNMSKKYQISGYHEWKILKKILREYAGKMNLIFNLEKEDKITGLKRNVLNLGPDDCRCIHCISPNDTIKVSIMYVKIKKIDLQIYFRKIKKNFRENIFPELMAKIWHPNRSNKWMFELEN